VCVCSFAARSTSADAAAKIGLPCDERGEINENGDGDSDPFSSILRFPSASPLCVDEKPDRFGEEAARTPMPEDACLGVPPPEENVPDENAEPAVPPSIASGDEGEEERAEDALIPLPSEYPPIDRGVEFAEPGPEPPSRRNSNSPLI
jgi:hypothetical protein